MVKTVEGLCRTQRTRRHWIGKCDDVGRRSRPPHQSHGRPGGAKVRPSVCSSSQGGPRTVTAAHEQLDGRPGRVEEALPPSTARDRAAAANAHAGLQHSRASQRPAHYPKEKTPQDLEERTTASLDATMLAASNLDEAQQVAKLKTTTPTEPYNHVAITARSCTRYEELVQLVETQMVDPLICTARMKNSPGPAA